ncbi:DUF3368 domain-containing protein [Oscillatoria salina]|nr:DUF3368 domain-containing protein [Oscillatoria salina]MBZ8180925.1 DUF3368 domain-containing protein [Oscillatoria salina IIICB1]NET89925.1 DUF3368 domain-containing protein [Kamptonema sp. SIO1D9]
MLLKAKQKGIISLIKPLLSALNKADFRLSEAIVQKALQLADE